MDPSITREVVREASERALRMLEAGSPPRDILPVLVRAAEKATGGNAVSSILLLDSDGLLRNGASPGLPEDYLGIWAGFWSAIGKSPALRKLNRELFDKDREAYEAIFEEIGRKRGKRIDTRRAALTVIALIDGFWLEWCLDPKSFTAAEAEAACLAFATQAFA
jgi:hypothetical protein